MVHGAMSTNTSTLRLVSNGAEGASNTFGDITNIGKIANTKTVFISGARDLSLGKVRADTIDASAFTGNLTIAGAQGATQLGVTITGGHGNDRLSGSDLNDLINGGDGNDLLLGLQGNDVLNGGRGNGLLSGGDGDDVLNGGTGIDTLWGGAGNDVYLIEGTGNIVTINETRIWDSLESSSSRVTGVDTIEFRDLRYADARFVQHNNDLVVTFAGVAEQVTIEEWFLGSDHQIEVFQFSDLTVTASSTFIGIPGPITYLPGSP